MYRLIREKSPGYFWVDSPCAALMSQVVVTRKHPSQYPALNSLLRASVRRSLDVHLADSLAPSLHDQFRDSLDAPLSASLVNPQYLSLRERRLRSPGGGPARRSRR